MSQRALLTISCNIPSKKSLCLEFKKVVVKKVLENSWESLGLQGDPTSPSWRKSVLNIHWKDWCWSWNSNTLDTWCEELSHLKRPRCWERLKARGEGDDRGWDGWMASPNRWIWVWVNSRTWRWTGWPGVLQSMGLQRVGHVWATELNWLTEESEQGLDLGDILEVKVGLPIKLQLALKTSRFI